MKKFWEDFKEFAFKGNAVSMAIGIVIGAAFTAIVNSLVGDIITPLLGIFGDFSFEDWVITIGENVTIKIGAFLAAVLNFFVIAFVLFLIMRFIMRLANEGQKIKEKVTEHDDGKTAETTNNATDNTEDNK